ncbi:uncharacterized protein BDR25DRAFT_354933 [Lindgomyces ingoldianus]|uniref:Uncharacterized protein n=1 Tax=Lindgomyces ingoldianus TaxID=673940 RepID=A0ACB6QY62_9PLEO|nr:uncharacterized protein BDR25DRAFT_354933 [Lindgomyces ingoldianus]KAF2471022.1 hypothetical protein BDR25DRAFT_354933 [Lindgomyces ingoldianus]
MSFKISRFTRSVGFPPPSTFVSPLPVIKHMGRYIPQLSLKLIGLDLGVHASPKFGHQISKEVGFQHQKLLLFICLDSLDPRWWSPWFKSQIGVIHLIHETVIVSLPVVKQGGDRGQAVASAFSGSNIFAASGSLSWWHLGNWNRAPKVTIEGF